jgi:CMP-N,N'-diacetyllegionaminic acid synthase
MFDKKMAIENDVLAIIPARGGSKSIKLKNLQSLNGLPLIAHSINTALQSNTVSRTIVSTDNSLVADTSIFHGAEVPFLRPSKISSDFSRDDEVIRHCIEWLAQKENYSPDFIIYLRPTYPSRNVEEIDRAITNFMEKNYACMARSVIPVEQTPFKMWKIESDAKMIPLLGDSSEDLFNSPRQLLPQVFWQDGFLDVFQRCYFEENCKKHEYRFSPIFTESTISIDIDYSDQLQQHDGFQKNRSVDVLDPERYSS